MIASCAGRRGPEEVDPLPGILRSADLAWAARGQTGLGPVAEALAEANRFAPHDPEVHWRWVRYHVGVGLSAEDRQAAATAFTLGREQGIRCLDEDPGFSHVRLAEGWEEALVVMEPERAPCALWTAHAWTRWLVEWGPEAAALDLPRIDALAAKVKALQGDPALADPVHAQQVNWTLGLLAAARPRTEGRDLAEGRRLLEDAVRQRPGELWRHLDFAWWVALPLGDDALFDRAIQRVLGGKAVTPEDARARDEARLLLAPPAEPSPPLSP